MLAGEDLPPLKSDEPSFTSASDPLIPTARRSLQQRQAALETSLCQNPGLTEVDK